MRGEWFSDKKTLSENFCISTVTFDRYFKNDARMKSIEYKKGTKLILWETEKAKQYMKDILSEIAE